MCKVERQIFLLSGRAFVPFDALSCLGLLGFEPLAISLQKGHTCHTSAPSDFGTAWLPHLPYLRSAGSPTSLSPLFLAVKKALAVVYGAHHLLSTYCEC